LIDPPSTVDRESIDDGKIEELAITIKEQGLLQAILLNENNGRFEIIAGHRRFLAFLSLERNTIPAKVVKYTKEQIDIARATENLAREDLSPIEEARVYQNLRDNSGISLDKISATVGKSVAYIKRRLDLLKMPEILRIAIHQRRISWSVGEELWRISDLNVLEYYLGFAVDNGCTASVARGWCKDWKDSKRCDKHVDGEGGEVFSPLEPRPVWLSCDVCFCPVQLGDEVLIKVCPSCMKLITSVPKESSP